MDVRTADAAVGDFDIDVVLSPLFRLERIPLHITLDGLRVVSQPPLEFIIHLSA